MVHSLNGDTNFFEIIIEVSQRDTLTPYMSKNYVLWISVDQMKKNCFVLKKKISS